MSRSRGRWTLIALALAGALAVRATACGGCHQDEKRRDPDERLALHFTHLCAIAEDGVDHPRPGIERFLRYHGDHSPDMASALAETLVVIERTADDGAHDRRARLARDRMRAPVVACEETLGEFFAAVAEDPQASRTLERATTRLNRTIEIVFGGGGGSVDPRLWLRRFDQLAERSR